VATFNGGSPSVMRNYVNATILSEQFDFLFLRGIMLIWIRLILCVGCMYS